MRRVSTATGVPAEAQAGRRGPASWPGRVAGRVAVWPSWAVRTLGVLAWAAAQGISASGTAKSAAAGG